MGVASKTSVFGTRRTVGLCLAESTRWGRYSVGVFGTRTITHFTGNGVYQDLTIEWYASAKGTLSASDIGVLVVIGGAERSIGETRIRKVE